MEWKKTKSGSPPLPQLYSAKRDDEMEEGKSPSPKPFVDVSDAEILADLQAEGLVRSPTLVDYKHEDNYAFLPGQIPPASIISSNGGDGSVSSSTMTTTTGSHTCGNSGHIVLIQDPFLMSHHHPCQELYATINRNRQPSHLNMMNNSSNTACYSTLTRGGLHHDHLHQMQQLKVYPTNSCQNHSIQKLGHHMPLNTDLDEEDAASIESSSQQQPILRSLSYSSHNPSNHPLLQSGHYHCPSSCMTNNSDSHNNHVSLSHHPLYSNPSGSHHLHPSFQGRHESETSSDSSSVAQKTSTSPSILDSIPTLMSSPQKLFNTLKRSSTSNQTGNNGGNNKRVSTLDRNSFLLHDHNHPNTGNSGSQRNSRNVVINESTPPRTVLENESHYY